MCLGQPPIRYCCPTTLVVKPIRSKYCANSGFVVARMDHYCVWLNNTIGYKNHRTFIIFLILQFLLSASFVVFIIRYYFA
jgi:palmitoyltransferase